MAQGKTTGVKKAAFTATIPLLWLLIFVLLELALVLAGVGYPSSLFIEPDDGLLVDNPEYVRRFYPVSDPPPFIEKSNLFEVEKGSTERRVFVVGGSTAQGFPYKRNHSFTAMAEAALKAAGADVDVVNVGNSAMSSYYVREVMHDLAPYLPDMVVVYAGHNEYYGTPSSFSGGNDFTRRALLQLKKLRTVQLIGSLVEATSGGSPSDAETSLMNRRFDEASFPPDDERDSAVAELFIRNLDAGIEELLDDGVAVSIFEPVSNLIGMPPFRGLGADSTGEASFLSGPAAVDPVQLYQSARQELDAGRWDRTTWEQARDADPVPFRARTVLVDRLRSYTQAIPSLGWIPTADELQRAAGPEAFGNAYFIDHLHFNFDGQRLLASMLAATIVDRLFDGDPGLKEAAASFLDDAEQVRNAIHFTAFWEFEAHTRVLTLREQEPYRSMPIAMEKLTYPSFVGQNPLFQTPDFLASVQGQPISEFFYIALDEYRRLGYQDEWLRNMNSYIQLFPGQHQSHLAYGMALLEASPRDYLEPAGGYFRRAYRLSGRDPEIRELVHQAIYGQGMGAAWDAFQLRYLY